MKFKLTILLLLLVLVSSLLMLTPTVTAQETTPNQFPTAQPENPQATEEVETVATEEIAATEDVPVVIVIEGDASPLPSTDSDWFSLRQIVELIGGLAVVVVFILRGGSILEGAGKFFEKVSGSQQITNGAMAQFNRLPPEFQSKIWTLIDVVDPLTQTTPADLDNRILAWLRKITAQADTSISG